MSTSTKRPIQRRQAYPHFHVVGLVGAYAPDSKSNRPDLEVKASCYISYHDDAYSALNRDARWKLERLGIPKERLDALYFEGMDIIERRALNAIGVRRASFDEPVEAFLDSPELKKRDVLIRQRRLIPYDYASMLAIYGPKVTAPTQEGVSA